MPPAERVLFIDGSAGGAGDMILGALVDLGVPLTRIRRAVESLPVDGWTLRSRKLRRCSIAARKIDVRVRRTEPGRGWKALRKILAAGDLESRVRSRSLEVFRKLIEAEAQAHGMDPEAVHLHEAGGTDAIVDIVGACVGFEHLKPSRIVASRLTTGFGRVRCAHGSYPVPAPATALLVRGLPVEAGEIEVERLTPTAAAILTTVVDDWSNLPPMRPLAVGYGAGDHDLGETPNLLRMVLGESGEGPGDALLRGRPEVGVLECTVDDSTPQALAYASRLLLESGALEVFTTAVTMKKGRAGHHLTVLARPEDLETLAATVFRETSTLGLRLRVEKRIELEREEQAVRTRYGKIRVKSGRLGTATVQSWPEYEDCATLARRHSVPLARLQRAALEALAATDRPERSRRGTSKRSKRKGRRISRG